MKPDQMRSGRKADAKDGFATTHWSLVLAARGSRDGESERALEKLCGIYWLPLYAYVRRRVSGDHEAQDLTQAFFERLLEKNYLTVVDPQRGRFRSFLITAFRHFLSNQWDRARAQKRGGGRRLVSLDFDSDACVQMTRSATDLTADQVYERQWAITLLNQVMNRLQREWERKGKVAQFHALKEFLATGNDGVSLSAAASHLGLTESAIRMAVSRMRRRYRELLRSEIAQTVGAPEEIDDEIRQLFRTFGS